ncbi:restriction endonuclease subunit S [Helicobacter rodentium]|uniref:restriction endonuclease subunit S n=1 Tax=Helicobacter rodentium TaxID=59617 RepID=UPI00068EA623|nr:restriction endonuclease subunit S [Helicobacter rodentium]
MTNNFHNLPKNWEVKTLAEVCTSKNSNIVLSSIENNTGKYPIYGAKGFLKTIDFYTIENESLGIVKDGAVGKIFLLPPKSSVIGTMAYIQANENLNLKYLYYFLHTINFNRYISGSVIPHIYFRDYKKEKIPLPPLEVQKAIVEKLENAFTHIDEAVRHLKAVQTNIPHLKSSLLYSAFSGKLTESQITAPTSTLSFSQRKSNPSPLPLTKEMFPFFCTKGEPAHSPLLAKNRAGGTTAPAFSDFSHHEVGAESHYDCHSKALAKESKDNNTHTLPKNWEVKTLGEVCEIVTGSTPSKNNAEYYGNDFPFYKPTDLNNGYYVEVASDNVSPKGFEISRQLPSGSVLVTCIGATIGKTGLIRKKGICNQQINAILPSQKFISEFIYFYCISPKVQNFIKTNASSTTLPILNKANFSKLPIPLPPLETQKQIVQILESKFAHLEKLAQFVNASLENLQRLKSSLLNQAFKGELIC